jgi:GGDEF domain-containing protein
VDDELVNAVLTLQPWVRSRPGAERFGAALRALVDAEACRRGSPDPVTGAVHVSALTQGPLLKPEYDLSVHAHAGWTVGAVIADVQEMIHVNQEAGFALGDRFLRAVASALSGAFPGAPVVRVHTDCFAALVVPSSGHVLQPAHLGVVSEALRRASDAFRAQESAPRGPVGFTVSAPALRGGPLAAGAGAAALGGDRARPPARPARPRRRHPGAHAPARRSGPYSSRMNFRGFSGIPFTRTS